MRILGAQAMTEVRLGKGSWHSHLWRVQNNHRMVEICVKVKVLVHRKGRKQTTDEFGRGAYGQKSPPDVWKIRVRPVGRHKHMVV